MPWDSSSIRKHNHSLSGASASKASSIANAVLQRTGDEGMALAVANKRINKLRKSGRISDKAHARMKRSSGLDTDIDAATA